MRFTLSWTLKSNLKISRNKSYNITFLLGLASGFGVAIAAKLAQYLICCLEQGGKGGTFSGNFLWRSRSSGYQYSI